MALVSNKTINPRRQFCRSPVLALALFLTIAAALASQEPVEVPHPSLEAADPLVRAHLLEERENFNALTRADHSSKAAHFAQAYSRLARVYHAYRYEEAALACYLNLEHYQAGVYPCLYAIGKIYHGRGRFDRALEYLRRAKRIADGYPDTPAAVQTAMLCLIGDACLKLNKPSEAKSAFQEAIDLDARCAFAWNGMGTALSMLGDPGGAIRCLERAVELQPRATAGRALLAREYRRSGQSGKASAVAPELQNNRTTPFAFYDPIIARDVAPLNRGAAAMEDRALRAKAQGNLSGAAALLEKAIELNPDSAIAKANLAGVYLSLNRLEAAESLAWQILEARPDDASFHHLLGTILFRRSQWSEALRSFENARELAPKQAAHSFWIAACLSWRGKDEEALAAFDRASELNPSDAGARIGAAIMLFRLGRQLEALGRLRRCIELFPDSAFVKMHAARLSSALEDGKAEDAGQALEWALSAYEGENSVDAAVAVAMARAALGDFSTAVRFQREAIGNAEGQGRAFDLPWLKRILELYQTGKPCREPWNPEAGFPVWNGQ